MTVYVQSLESHCYSPGVPRQGLRITTAAIRAREDRRRGCQGLARGNTTGTTSLREIRLESR